MSEQALLKLLSHPFPSLKHIQLDGLTITPRIAAKIFTQPYFTRLVLLDLSNTNLDDNSFKFLEELPNKKIKSTLQVLKLDGLLLGKKGFVRLARINFGGLLRQLDVQKTLLIEEEAVDRLQDMICKFSTHKDYTVYCRSKLEFLDISETEISRDGFIDLITTLNLSALTYLQMRRLNLHYPGPQDKGFNYSAYKVFASLDFDKLNSLNLHNCHINQDIAIILATNTPRNLHRFFLPQNPIGDRGMQKLLNKTRLYRLRTLNIYQTGISDETMTHIRKQSFWFAFFHFGNRGITGKGLKELTFMNLTRLHKLVLTHIQVKPDEVINVINSIYAPDVESILIMNMNDLGNMLTEVQWQRFPILSSLSIQNANLDSSLSAILALRETLNSTNSTNQSSLSIPFNLPSNLTQLSLQDINFNFTTYSQLIFMIPLIFPRLNTAVFGQSGFTFMISLLRLSQIKFKQSFILNLGHLVLGYFDHRWLVLKMFYPQSLLYNYQGRLIEQYHPSFESHLQNILDIYHFREIQGLRIGNLRDFGIIHKIIRHSNVTQLHQLRLLYLSYQINTEYFFDVFNANLMPNLQIASFNLIVPGDTQSGFVDKVLLPFFTSLKSIRELTLSLSFLNEDINGTQKQLFMNSLHYIYLTKLVLPRQQLKTKDFTTFISKHSSSLRDLNLNGNFLQNDFFSILAKNQIYLMAFSLNQTSFSVDQFKQFGKMETGHLRELDLSANQLTDHHIIEMLKTKAPGPFFPQLNFLKLVANNIREQGLQALLQTLMLNLLMIQLDKNINPEFVNLMLKYTNNLRGLSVKDIEVYSLNDINQASVSQISSLSLQTYSFSQQDFKTLGKLQFTNLEVVNLYLKNIYKCEVMKDLLRINRWAHTIMHNFKNDQQGLNSQCLLDEYQYFMSAEKIYIYDEYSTTFLPQFVEIITRTKQTIKELVLINTRLSPNIMRIILGRNLNKIQILVLKHNYLDDEGLSTLLLNNLNNLKQLSLKASFLKPSSFIKLFKKGLPSLQYLQLSQNPLNAEVLSSLKKVSIYVKQIDLSNCKLNGTSLQIIGDMFAPSLIALVLDNNEFSENQVIDFIANLKKIKKPNLKQISLRGVLFKNQNYDLAIKTINKKGIIIHLDPPYNFKQQNSAHY